MRTHMLTALLAVTLTAAPALAQDALKAPQASPEASVSQTVGLTDITVRYHRPAIHDRTVWGELVPYGEVWRAGANENTTIRFSSPVKVGGKTLLPGTYGLFMLPTPTTWTIIFSNASQSWGAYSYDAKEDAARVTVTPQKTADRVERLNYELDDPSDDQVTVALRWEKLRVPFTVEVDTPAVVMASMRSELRGLQMFYAPGWAQAADYWLHHGGKLDEAEKMAVTALKKEETFMTLSVRAAVADKRGDGKLAATTRQKAYAMGSERELNQYGYELLNVRRNDEAIAVFKANTVNHPQSQNVWDSLGEAYEKNNDKAQAIAAYDKALALAKDEPTKKRLQKTLAKLKP